MSSNKKTTKGGWSSIAVIRSAVVRLHGVAKRRSCGKFDRVLMILAALLLVGAAVTARQPARDQGGRRARERAIRGRVVGADTNEPLLGVQAGIDESASMCSPRVST